MSSGDFTNGTNDNFTWWTTASTSDNNLFFGGTAATTIDFTNYTKTRIKTPDKDWMPYNYIEYEPKWHKKFARYKNQMEHMWD